jgi:Fic family protein
VIHASIEKLNEYIERKQREKMLAIRFVNKYPLLNARQQLLLATALEKPLELFTIETHQRIHGTTYQTARTDLLGLKSMGLLDMRKEGKKFVFNAAVDLTEKLK